MSTPIALLRDRHVGQTGTIVGKGPSVLRLTRDLIPAGPVIVLNDALINVLSLNLPNPLYSMQKDGGDKSLCCAPCGDRCQDMRRVPAHVTLLVHTRESPHCYAGHTPRYLFDNPRDFGLAVHAASLPTAIKVAELLGCARLVLISMDAATTGNLHTTEDGLTVTSRQDGHYLLWARQAQELLAHSTQITEATWLTPLSDNGSA